MFDRNIVSFVRFTFNKTVFSEEKEERKKMVYCFPFGYRKNVERK